MNTVEAVIEKKGIPLKSKIAAWWMLIVGGITVIVFPVLSVLVASGSTPDAGIFVLFLLFICASAFVLYLLPGLLVLEAGRWGWITASVILSLVTFGLSIFGYSLNPLYIFPFLIPLTLILLDHLSYKLVLLLLILVFITYVLSLIIM
jgi:hypothetical protein